MAWHQGQGKAEEIDDETAFQQGPYGYGPRVFSKVRRYFFSCPITAAEMLVFEICSVDEPRAITFTSYSYPLWSMCAAVHVRRLCL